MTRALLATALGLAIWAAAQAQGPEVRHGRGIDYAEANKPYHGHRGDPRRPMHAGNERRPENWNSDGAPRPPLMWRGRGASWPRHYSACRQRYSSYDYRSDTYRRHGRPARCTL